MKTLLETKKITLATLKAFAKRNAENLFIYEKSSFDGMTDCVQENRDAKWHNVTIEKAYGHNGVWLVGSNRDYFTLYADENYIGIEVYNCCGTGILAIKK
jgi:hypothetical protein